MWEFRIIISLIVLGLFVHYILIKEWLPSLYERWTMMEDLRIKTILKPFGFCPQCVVGQFVFWGLLIFCKYYIFLDHVGITALSILLIKLLSLWVARYQR